MHHRQSIRLRDYDYTQQGAYFITICGHERMCLFGNVFAGEMKLNTWGQIILEAWEHTAIVRPHVELDAFVVMPNHIHGILVITKSVSETRPFTPTYTLHPGSLGAMMGQFKSSVTKRIQRLPHAPEHPIWQRNYYEHIIRNEKSLNMIRSYILNNPAKWIEDTLYRE